MVVLHGRGGATAEIGVELRSALDMLAEVLILQTHHAMEKPEPYCRRYLAFKPEEAESILRGADDLATSTLNTAHSCMHTQSMFSTCFMHLQFDGQKPLCGISFFS